MISPTGGWQLRHYCLWKYQRHNSLTHRKEEADRSTYRCNMFELYTHYINIITQTHNKFSFWPMIFGQLTRDNICLKNILCEMTDYPECFNFGLIYIKKKICNITIVLRYEIFFIFFLSQNRNRTFRNNFLSNLVLANS